MFVNFIGALTFSVIGYFYTRFSGKNGTKVVEGLMITKNPNADAPTDEKKSE